MSSPVPIPAAIARREAQCANMRDEKDYTENLLPTDINKCMSNIQDAYKEGKFETMCHATDARFLELLTNSLCGRGGLGYGCTMVTDPRVTMRPRIDVTWGPFI